MKQNGPGRIPEPDVWNLDDAFFICPASVGKSIYGYNFLKDLVHPWDMRAQVALQHHERLDGSGYPLGLKGEEILLEASIVVVADVVEAMSTHRPYRPALGIDKALEEISKNKGKLYDPEVVDACIKLFKEGRFTFNS